MTPPIGAQLQRHQPKKDEPDASGVAQDTRLTSR